MLKKLLLVGLSLLAMPLLPRLAAAQSLDPTFTPPTGLYTLGAVYSMAAQQADGKRVVAGYFSRVNNTAVGTLVRLDATGALDATFAQNVGVARNTFRVKALPNGQYLVSSFFDEAVTAGGLTRPSLLRLNANGTADATFNAGSGAASSDLSGAQLNTFVGQADGKALVGGAFTSFSGQNTGGLVRLTSTGALDAVFNANLGTGFTGPVNTVAVQPDGKIVVGGTFTALNGQPTGSLLRLNADGTRDATFTSVLPSGAYIGALLVQPDSKILVTGVLGSASIVRLTATGSVDTGFAAPSYTATYASSSFDANVLLQPDGKLIFFGTFTSGGAAYIIRLNPNGSADTSFSTGSNGALTYPYSIGLQSDGSLWVGGGLGSLNNRETALGRLASNGAIDTSFTPKIQAPGSVKAVVRQADGQLIVGGNFSEYNGVTVHHLARLSATGTLDAAFAAATEVVVPGQITDLALQPDGKLLIGTSSGVRRLLTTGRTDASYGTFTATTYVDKLALQPDGKAIVLGSFFNIPGSNSIQYIARLSATGDYDASFSPGTANVPGSTFYLTALALQPDGKVLVGGSFLNATTGSPVLRVLRYESTGAVDASFSSSTMFELPPLPPGGGPVVRFNALAVQPDGKVLVGGYFATVSGAARTNLARLTATGQLDATFVPAALTGAVTAVALQANGRVLVGSGYGNDGSATTTPLVRLLDTGTSDPSFGTSATPDNEVAALLVQPNGAVVVGGSFTTINGQASSGLARLLAPNTLAIVAPTAPATFSAWPVPAHGLLHVAVEADAQAAELRDALGRVVRQRALRGAGAFTITTEGLLAGIYVLRVQYAGGTVSRQVAVE